MQYNLYNCDLRNNLRITNSVRGSFPEYENDNDNPPPPIDRNLTFIQFSRTFCVMSRTKLPHQFVDATLMSESSQHTAVIAHSIINRASYDSAHCNWVEY